MTQPLYNLQLAKETLGLSGTHIPTTEELEKIKSEKFASYPGSAKSPTGPALPAPHETSSAVLGDFFAVPLENVVAIRDKVIKKGSIFYGAENQGITATNSDKSILTGITFDLILNESHELTASVCTHPVQNAEPVSDHVQPLPTKVKFQILVTEFSIKDGRGGWRGGSFDPSVSRGKAALEAFKTIFAKRMVCTIVLVLDTYPEMIITSVTAARDGSTGEAQVYDIEAVQILRTSLSKAQINSVARPADTNSDTNRRMSGTASVGRQTPGDAEFNADEETVP